MPLNFNISEMTSIVVRNESIAKYGKRIVTSLESYDASGNNSGANNIFKKAWNLGKKVAGMIGNFVTGLLSNFSISGCWSWLTQTWNYVYNFNWNSTDTELRTQIKQQWNVLAGMAGGIVGNSLGYLACGFVPGAITFQFNEALGAKIIKNVGEEFIEEFSEGVSQIASSTFRLGTQILLTELFINVRKIIKNNSAAIAKFFGSERLKKMIDAWGKPGSKPWSFSQKVQEKIESIPNSALQNFTEEAVEEMGDACVEAGYIVANTFDAELAKEAYKQEYMPVLGKMKYVEVKPNRKNDDEVWVMAGNTELLKNNIVNALNTHQIISSYDVGTITEIPTEHQFRRFKPHIFLKFTELSKDKPKDANRSLLKMTISFRLMQETSTAITIERLKQLAAKIEQKFGGKTPYKINKGRYLFSYADHEKGYQLMLWVSGADEARRIVDDVLFIQAHKPDWDLLQQKALAQGGKEKEVVLGEPVEQESRGNSGIVTFNKAYCVLDKRPKKPVYLIDIKGRKKLFA
jgi:hypothetical protein